MRVAEATGYRESRDAVAHDWYGFLRFALPDTAWMVLPNLGDEAGHYAATWGVDALVLTGGNDVGEAEVRDRTEHVLLDYALARDVPLFGVCRGLQVIQHYFGGQVGPCSAERHVTRSHEVIFATVPAMLGEHIRRSSRREVNSYHRMGVRLGDVVQPLEAFATAEDGIVEGLWHPGKQIVAIQWHPERERPYSEEDRQLMRTALALETG